MATLKEQILILLSNSRSASTAIFAGVHPRRSDDLRIEFVFPRVLRKSMNTPVSK